ncbi:hypothetical protein ACFFLS_10075 [Flavobacterium procerum]|uniref:Uncharacterized protein n=1 Tax=Flavobacterium procerum TaxID=1455569 RepID=A0ABV6BRW7_9FLAO
MKNHFFENGSWLTISNSNIKDKTFHNFFGSNAEYKALVINEDADLKYPIVLNLLKEVILEKASKRAIMDIELSTEETLGIKNIFEREINHLLSIRKTAKTGYNIKVFGKEILIDTRNEIHDMNLSTFNDIYLIAKECLDENKPMYLSID